MGIEPPQAKVEDLLATNMPSSREMSSLKASCWLISSSESLIVLVGWNEFDSVEDVCDRKLVDP
jgi:hypothetical protein